jgi:hypothetical protein
MPRWNASIAEHMAASILCQRPADRPRLQPYRPRSSDTADLVDVRPGSPDVAASLGADKRIRSDIAVANHVPEIVILFLLGLSIITIGVVGYGDGLAGTRRPGLTAVFAVIAALVVLLIIDLDHPQKGLTRSSQESMSRLQAYTE